MPHRSFSRLLRVLLCLGLATAAAPVRADATAGQGAGFDAQVTGGGGFAFRSGLDNNFLGRVRFGGLYASQPWIANLGGTLQFGALARFGVGAELELNHGSGPYGSVGIARVTGDEWMTHAALGFMIFGVEWQHRWSSSSPSDALMFEVRLPLGVWWLLKRKQSATETAADARRMATVQPFVPVQPEPVSPPTAAPTTAGARAAEAPPPKLESTPLVLPPAQETERAQQLEAARLAHEKGDHVAEALALARAEKLRPEVPSALALAAAHVENGKLLMAHAQLTRVFATYALTAEERPRVEAELKSVAARLAHLRLIANGAQEQDHVLIDAAREPSALAGYDVPLDPGEHQLQVVRGERVLAERSFHAGEGELVRLTVELPAQPGS